MCSSFQSSQFMINVLDLFYVLFQSSRSLLLAFSREYLKGEGDITKHLSYLGFSVTHEQVHLTFENTLCNNPRECSLFNSCFLSATLFPLSTQHNDCNSNFKGTFGKMKIQSSEKINSSLRRGNTSTEQNRAQSAFYSLNNENEKKHLVICCAISTVIAVVFCPKIVPLSKQLKNSNTERL